MQPDAYPPAMPIRTSPLRGTCAACGDEIQPDEPHRRGGLKGWKAYHLACAPVTPRPDA